MVVSCTDWVTDPEGNSVCTNEDGTYTITSDNTVYFESVDGMSGWWNDGTNYDIWWCWDESYDTYDLQTCQGDGFEDEYTLTWISYDYTFTDGTSYYEVNQNGESGMYNTWGYYENSNGEWFYGETTEEASYY